VNAVQHGITDGATNVFLVAALASVVGLIGSLFIKQVTLRGSIPRQASAPEDSAMDVAHA
jgi:hypothetical protein